MSPSVDDEDVSSSDMVVRRGEVGRATVPPGATLGPRHQPHLQLVLLVTGSMAVAIDDGPPRRAAAPAAAALLPGHEERFHFDAASETAHWWVHAAVAPLAEHMRARWSAVAWPQPLAPGLVDLARQALAPPAAVARRPADQAALRTALVTAMLWRYLLDAEQAAQPLPEPVARVLAWIDDRFDQPTSLQDLARVGYVGREQLIRLFRTHLGRTPMAHLQERRVAAGLDLLVGTGLPVAAIAARCGFATPQHFARHVRRATGATPSQVRARGRGAG